MGRHGVADRRRNARGFRGGRPRRPSRCRPEEPLRERGRPRAADIFQCFPGLYYRRNEGVSPVSTTTMDDAGKLFADPLAYTDERRLPAARAPLRASAPVSWVDAPDYRPFWAITKHADIMDIERNNTLFTNWPRPVLATRQGDELQS